MGKYNNYCSLDALMTIPGIVKGQFLNFGTSMRSYVTNLQRDLFLCSSSLCDFGKSDNLSCFQFTYYISILKTIFYHQRTLNPIACVQCESLTNTKETNSSYFVLVLFYFFVYNLPITQSIRSFSHIFATKSRKIIDINHICAIIVIFKTFV